MFWNRKLKQRLAEAEGQLSSIKNEAGSLQLSQIKEWAQLFGGTSSVAGIPVSATSAMRASTVFACVGLIASAISSSPCQIFQRTDAEGNLTNILALDHPQAAMLRLRPNPFISSSIFWKFIAQHKLLSGNAYALIVRDRGGNPLQLLPCLPWRVIPWQAWQLGFDKSLGCDPLRLFYQVTLDYGRLIMVDQDDMLHFPNLGWDGRRGLSTISYMAQTVGLALVEEKHQIKLFEQGATFDYSISYPGALGDEAQKNLKKNLLERGHGLDNTGLPLILTGDAKILPFSMSSKDAEIIASRKFSIEDCCRFFRVPPIMVGETAAGGSSRGTSIEQLALWFTKFTLNDHFSDIEQELDHKLLRDGQYRAQFDDKKLLRGDLVARGTYYAVARGNIQQPGYLSINEIRAEEGYPPDADPQSDELQRPMVNIEPPSPAAKLAGGGYG